MGSMGYMSMDSKLSVHIFFFDKNPGYIVSLLRISGSAVESLFSQ